MPLILRLTLAVAALLSGLLLAARMHPEKGAFLTGEQDRPSGTAAPSFATIVLNTRAAGSQPMVHVASPAAYPGGLATVWYGGTSECAPDVRIWFSGNPDADPAVIMTREKASRDLGRPVQALGNALLIADHDGSLRLLFVTIAMGKWSGSQLNSCVSKDGGLTWSRAERLTLSPFFNLAELVRNRPLPLADGGWCVPVYQEFLGKFPELLWLGRDGSWRKSRIAGGCTSFQPSVVPLDGRRAIALMRDYTPARRIHLARTEDGGRSWTKPIPTSLPNPDAGISALRLSDGRILLAYNDSTIDRRNLSWAVSGDEGISWRRIGSRPDQGITSFSYPYLLREGERIDQAFTADGKRIILDRFNEGFLDRLASPANP